MLHGILLSVSMLVVDDGLACGAVGLVGQGLIRSHLVYAALPMPMYCSFSENSWETMEKTVATDEVPFRW